MSDEQFLQHLHARFDDAHSGTPGASSPPPDLWNRILTDQHDGRAKTMNVTSTPDSMATSVTPVPRPWRIAHPEGSNPRSGRLTYAATAAILVLAMMGGLFIASQRSPDGNDFGDLRYAAQPVSPEASPITAIACDVEPMTVDEVMAVVENPYVNMDQQRLNIAGFPSFLTDEGGLLLLDDFGKPMDPGEEADARDATAVYLTCRQNGSLGQVFALMSPDKIQQTVFWQFPAFRAEEDVRAFLEAALPAPAQEVMFNPLFETDATIVPATGEGSALTWSPHPQYPVAYIGTQGIDASGNVLAVSDAHDNIEVIGEFEGRPPTLGAVSLVQYPGDARWYVNDAEIVRDVGSAMAPGAEEEPQSDPSVEGAASPEVAVCMAEPMTAETMLQLLEDPDAYAVEVLGVDSVTPEGATLLEDIRQDPESLVLASVTGDTGEAMLVLPQEGVLPAAGNYLDCWQQGSAGQTFSFMAPHMIAEYDRLVGLPRDGSDLQAMLDAPARDLPASDRIMPTFVLDEGRTITVADTGGTHGFAGPFGGFDVAFVATNTNDSDGNPLIGGNIDDRSLDWARPAVEVDGRMSFGALTLIRYPGTDQWLVYDHWIELDPEAVSADGQTLAHADLLRAIRLTPGSVSR